MGHVLHRFQANFITNFGLDLEMDFGNFLTSLLASSIQSSEALHAYFRLEQGTKILQKITFMQLRLHQYATQPTKRRKKEKREGEAYAGER